MSMKSFLPSLWSQDDDRRRDAFQSLHREVDQLFSDFRKGFQFPAAVGFGATDGGLLSPKIDVSETEKAFDVSVELPGVDEKDVEVTLTDNILTIKGEKKSETEDKSKDYHVIERSYGSFRRSLALPFEADGDAVKAEFKNGVLKVSLQKPEDAEKKVRKISISQS